MADSKIRGPVETKNRQKVMAVSLAGGFLLLMMLALWVSDPKDNTRDYVSERGSLAKDYRAQPAGGVSEEQHWISKSEEEFAQLQLDAKRKDQQINKLISRLEGIESKGNANVSRLEKKVGNVGNGQLRDRQALEELNRLVREGASEEKILAMIKSHAPEATSTPVQVQAPAQAPTRPAPAPAPARRPAPSLQNPLARRLPPPPAARTMPRSNPAVVANTAGGEPKSPFQYISLKQPESEKDKSKDELAKNISRYLPTGTLSKGVFLTGVDAPTGGQSQSNPHPVLARVKSFGNLPNFAQSYIKDCHILGAATGNISSERVEIRLETLTCILKDGGIIEVPIKGYVTGEDGKMGMRGRVVEKQGQLIARALVAGTLGGVSSAVQQQSQTFSISPLGNTSTIDPKKIGQAGVGGGLSTTMEKLADYYFSRLDEMYPVIEMDAGRICDIILTGGTDLKHKIVGNTYDSAD